MSEPPRGLPLAAVRNSNHGLDPCPELLTQSSTYMWAAEALDLLALAYGSITTAERVLLRGLKADWIPWTYMDVDPPGSNVERMWQQLQYTLKPQLAQNQATFLRRGMDLETIKVGGIKVERAAIMALLPADCGGA